MQASLPINLLLLIPLTGALVVGVLPKGSTRIFRVVNLISTSALLINSLFIYYYLSTQSGSFPGINRPDQFALMYQVSWFRLELGNLGVISTEYFLALDGLNAPMILLSGIVLFMPGKEPLCVER
jgi:NADH-quinone oxidoreductase subunit M